MAEKDRRDDANDVDRLIDEAIEAMAGPRPVDLRAEILRRLDEPPPEPAAPLAFLLRPAVLAVAGTLFIAAGVTVTWRLADQKLAPTAITGARSTVQAGRAPGSRQPSVATRAPEIVPPAGVAQPAAAMPGPSGRLAATDAGRGRASLARADLAQGAMLAAADEEVLAWEPAERYLPGAPGGDLGDPIAPLPMPPPIVIRPIAPPPIVVAPPVSELATPVGPVPIDDPTRVTTAPGKTGGVRP